MICSILPLKQKVLVPFLLIIFGCTSCNPAPPSPPKNKQDIVKSRHVMDLSCNSFETVETPIGNLQNNVWNKNAAQDYPWIQCLSMRINNSDNQYGWYWSWPPVSDVVFAQPQITLGQTPWSDHAHPIPNYPIPVNSLKKLDIAYDVEMTVEGDTNLVATLWITNIPTIPREVNKQSIVAELKVWTYTTENFYAQPGGKKVGELTSADMSWEVWADENRQEASRVNNNQWTYIAFRAKQNTLKIHYDMYQLINYCIEKGLLKKDIYIADIQLGNDILRGKGETWLKSFNVNIQKQ